jgi:hypothetical protein
MGKIFCLKLASSCKVFSCRLRELLRDEKGIENRHEEIGWPRGTTTGLPSGGLIKTYGRTDGREKETRMIEAISRALAVAANAISTAKNPI